VVVPESAEVRGPQPQQNFLRAGARLGARSDRLERFRARGGGRTSPLFLLRPRRQWSDRPIKPVSTEGGSSVRSPTRQWYFRMMAWIPRSDASRSRSFWASSEDGSSYGAAVIGSISNGSIRAKPQSSITPRVGLEREAGASDQRALSSSSSSSRDRMRSAALACSASSIFCTASTSVQRTSTVDAASTPN
jgi:hypothetical protein